MIEKTLPLSASLAWKALEAGVDFTGRLPSSVNGPSRIAVTTLKPSV